MKRVKYTYYCDVCKKKIKNYPTEYNFPCIFQYKDNPKKIIDSHSVHICDGCAIKVIDFITGITVKKEIPEGDEE